jgi:hypothetical protein
VTAHLISGKGHLREWWKLPLAGAVSVAAAFFTSPYLFLDYATFLRDLSAEAGNTNGIPKGYWGNVVWYFWVIEAWLGWAGIVLSLVAVSGGIVRTRKPTLVVVSFPVAYVALISGLIITWERWMIPLVPFVAIFVARGLQFLWQAVVPARLAPYRWLPAAVCSLILVMPSAQNLSRRAATANGSDSRTVARSWIMENIPEGSSLLLEVYTPQLPFGRFDISYPAWMNGNLLKPDPNEYSNVFAKGFAGEAKAGTIHEAGIEYVVLSSAAYGRFKTDPRKADIWASYQRLFSQGTTIYEVAPNRGADGGPKITVLQMQR